MTSKPSHDQQEQHEQHGGVREKLHDAKDAASRAYGKSSDAAAQTAHRAAQTIDSNPLGIVVGGLAVGAVVGALIPRSAKEQELLAPLGRQLKARAQAAVAAAREAGRDALDEQGLSRDQAKDRARGLVDGVVKAVSTAGTAAARSAAGKTG